MSKLTVIGQRLYRGDVSINFVGRWKTWYVISGIIFANQRWSATWTRA